MSDVLTSLASVPIKNLLAIASQRLRHATLDELSTIFSGGSPIVHGRGTAEGARDEVFARWLSAKRRSAKIEWHWGRGELPGDEGSRGAVR
jgi:hypothetical protein